jgi:hypothetical protein
MRNAIVGMFFGRPDPFAQLAPRSRAILKKVLCGDNGIATRHLSLNPLTEVFNLTPDALQARFTRHAPAIGHGGRPTRVAGRRLRARRY